MEVLVRLGCDCEFPCVDCPECRGKESILRWLPLNLLPLLERPYIVVDRRHVDVAQWTFSDSDRLLTPVTYAPPDDTRAGY